MVLSWALMFLAVAIIAGVFGFGGIVGASAWIAQVLFIFFLVFFLMAMVTGKKPPVA